jgi:hypothetical protein
MKLFEVANKAAWVWATACHAATDRAVCGCDNGAIELTQMTFSAVHSLYRDRYAYRENLTEIIVHHLGGSDRKVSRLLTVSSCNHDVLSGSDQMQGLSSANFFV